MSGPERRGGQSDGNQMRPCRHVGHGYERECRRLVGIRAEVAKTIWRVNSVDTSNSLEPLLDVTGRPWLRLIPEAAEKKRNAASPGQTLRLSPAAPTRSANVKKSPTDGSSSCVHLPSVVGPDQADRSAASKDRKLSARHLREQSHR